MTEPSSFKMKINRIHFKELPSTSRWALENFSSLDQSSFHVVIADKQTSGYGQHGRAWLSQEGKSLTLSFIFFLPKLPANLGEISLALAVTYTEIFRRYGIPCKIKWPNDLMFQDKKVGGLLGEVKQHNDYYAVIFGVGLNILQKASDLQSIAQGASSLLLANPSCKWDLQKLEKIVTEESASTVVDVLKNGFTSYQSRANEVLWRKNKDIQLQKSSESITGRITGVSNHGYLLFKPVNEEEQVITTGRIQH